MDVDGRVAGTVTTTHDTRGGPRKLIFELNFKVITLVVLSVYPMPALPKASLHDGVRPSTNCGLPTAHPLWSRPTSSRARRGGNERGRLCSLVLRSPNPSLIFAMIAAAASYLHFSHLPVTPRPQHVQCGCCIVVRVRWPPHTNCGLRDRQSP